MHRSLAICCVNPVPAAPQCMPMFWQIYFWQLLMCPQCLPLDAGHFGQLTVPICPAACLLQPAEGGH